MSQSKPLPSRGLKQVKVDNWGTFFLQRLQQLYFEEELLDLTIRFPTSDITVQAHRLVITTCTDYFVKLERQQRERDENFDGVIVMPSDMPYECVKSIISFMYTGQLEYWTSEQHALYRTAQKMNMSVLTKLLDAQFNTSTLQPSDGSPKGSGTTPTTTSSSSSTTTTTSKTSNTSNASNSSKKSPPTDLLSRQPLPGRKLPIWKRRLDPPTGYDYSGFRRSKETTTPGPSRFDLPEADDIALGVFSSFDDITYDTKPIVQAPETRSEEHEHGSGSSPTSYRSTQHQEADDDEDEDEDEFERKRAGSASDRNPGKTGGGGSSSNTFDFADIQDQEEEEEDDDEDWIVSSSRRRQRSDSEHSSTKRVRFDLEEKENLEKAAAAVASDESISNHAKIIREVLKKYPNLVKNNKNIRLKIMQKEGKHHQELTGTSKTKVSYVVLKSDHLMAGEENNPESAGGALSVSKTSESHGGPYKCTKCDLEEEYTNYYMYRRHMQDVHDERFDPRVCEHCGYRATKRNILMYHLYTKHNVPPPKNMNFPKCQSCPYVALSETLLVKHQINHNHRPPGKTLRYQSGASGDQQEYRCTLCMKSFASINDLASHELAAGHLPGVVENKDKGYRCPHCSKTFVRLTNLQVHLDCVHKNLRLEQPVLLKTTHQVQHQEQQQQQQQQQQNQQQQLQEQEQTSIQLEPSSEAEALSNVASGIAASLNVGNEDEEVEEDATNSGDGSFVVPVGPGTAYNGLEGQQMIMLIDDGFQTDQDPDHPNQPQQLDLSDNQQIVMQGTENGMIVYIHGNDDQAAGKCGTGSEISRESFEQEQMETTDGQDLDGEEEIVEEVVEEVIEQEEGEDEGEENVGDFEELSHATAASGEQIEEEVIQYVEEQTEIVEYDEGEEVLEEEVLENHQEGKHGTGNQGESVMIIEEIDDEDLGVGNGDSQGTRGVSMSTSTRTTGKQQEIAEEWDDDSADA